MGQYFTARNIQLFVLSLALLAVGYVLLGQGPVDNPLSVVAAPLILVTVYCALIPAAILFRGKEKGTNGQRPK